MYTDSKTAEMEGILAIARAICVAARTAPKACGTDILDTAILTGAEKDELTRTMREIGESAGIEFFVRDAGNVDAASAIVLVGATYAPRGLAGLCGLCGFPDCAACVKAGAACVYPAIDLGIALGSAVSLAADLRADNRIMFTAGKAAAKLGLLGEHRLIMGVPLYAGGKSVFFDRDGGRRT